MPTIKSHIKDTTTANLKKYLDDKVKKIKNLVVDSITEVEELATRQAPSFVSVDKRFEKGDLRGIVGVMGDDPLAAYFEFGTGLSAIEILAPYPQWVKDIAEQFYINGLGTLKGRPYLFNNFLVVEQAFRAKLEDIINEQITDN